MMEFTEIGNPFPGLRPFELSESNLFFGREGQSDELLARLQRKRFLAVVGTSGSGKSSLVRAGLLPALYGGLMGGAGSSWRIAILRPGHDPIGNLAGALDEQKLVPKSISKDLHASDLILDDDALKLETKASPRPEELPMESEASEIGVITATNPDSLFQHAIIETTLRRSTLGLADVARQARMPAHENLLIVVDQFEELFRFKEARKETGSEDDAAAFVKLLIEASAQAEAPIYVVLTMRSDFLGDCSQFAGLPEAINQGQYLIPRMSRDERRAAITGPVAVGGGEITLPLVSRLLNDVGDNPDQLPILQHALMRTWDYCTAHRRNGEALGIEHYEAIGTMSEALSRHADEAFDELPDDRSRVIAEKLFKGLTEKGADNRETRRPTRLAEICAVAEATEDEVLPVINVFRSQGRSFLMPPTGSKLNSETIIDISHESLIRNWTRLQKWVNEEAQSARVYRRLADDALLRHEGKTGLLDDPRLQLTLDWRDEHGPTAAWAARYHDQFDLAAVFPDAKSQAECHAVLFDLAMSYLEDSRDARDEYLKEERRRALEETDRQRRDLENAAALADKERRLAENERQRAEEQAAAKQRELESAKVFAAQQSRTARRLRWLLAGMAVMFLLALATAGYAVIQRRQAIVNEKKAKSNEDLARQREQEAVQALTKEQQAQAGRRIAEAGEQKARAGEKTALARALSEAERATQQARLAQVNAAKAGVAEAKANTRAREAEAALDAKNRAEIEAAKSAKKDTLNRAALEALQRYEFTRASGMFQDLIKLSAGDLMSEGWATYNLGSVYLKQGRYFAAQDAYKDALGKLRTGKSEKPGIAVAMNGLAQVYKEARAYPLAEAQYRELLDAAVEFMRLPNENYLPFVAEVNADLGDVYRQQGKFVEAKESYGEAIKSWRQVESDSLGLADRFKSIAEFYLEQEEYKPAEELYLRAYEIWNKTLLPDNLTFARDLVEIASMYRSQGKYTEADKYYRQARAAWEKQTPSTDLAVRYQDLAQFYRQWGKLAEANELSSWADETLKEALDKIAPQPTNPTGADAIETLLPESGIGYATNNRGVDGAFQYGRAETIRAIIRLGIEWERRHPSLPFSVGTISKKGGGPLPRYITHRNGREFDIRPMRNDGLNQPVTITDPNYSYSLTKELVLLIREICPDVLIFFNDEKLVKEELTDSQPGQNNQVYVRLPTVGCPLKAR
jgi:tetratricopeptide (TPR) repeat protein